MSTTVSTIYVHPDLIEYRDNKYNEKAKKAIKYMDGLPYPGEGAAPNSFHRGVVTSLLETGQQWDYP